MNKYMTLRQKTNIRIFLRLLLILLVGALIFYICGLTAATSKYSDGETFATHLFGLIVWAWFVYMTKFIPLLLDRDWDGKIISVSHRNGWYCPYATFGRGGIRATVYIDLVVQRSNGRKRKVSYNSAYMALSYYHEGMEVTHKKGAKYLVYKNPPKDKIICPMCTETLDTCSCNRCKIRF